MTEELTAESIQAALDKATKEIISQNYRFALEKRRMRCEERLHKIRRRRLGMRNWKPDREGLIWRKVLRRYREFFKTKGIEF